MQTANPITSTASDAWQSRSTENALRYDPRMRRELASFQFKAQPIAVTAPVLPVRNPNYWREWNAWRLDGNAPAPKAFL